MKRLFSLQSTTAFLGLSLALFLGGLFIPSLAFAALVDKVVAVVNDEVITLSEVEEEATRMYQALAKESSGQALVNSLAEAREATLNGLIDRRLISQRAKSTNTTVSDEELAAAVDTTRNRANLSPAEFKNKLERSGLTEEMFRKQLREQVLQSKLVSYDVRAKIVVTDEMIRDYYNERYSASAAQGSFYLLQMGFLVNPEITDPEKLKEEKAKTRKRAEQALALVRKGEEEFKALAKKISDLPSAADGGDLGILKLDDMAPAMSNAVAPLKPGEVSGIVETSDGYQFFKVLSEKEGAASASSYEPLKEEIREKLHEEKLKAAYSEWVKQLRESAYIQKL
jgi:peptidyl-prolyl cis-trans isomerase SurA